MEENKWRTSTSNSERITSSSTCILFWSDICQDTSLKPKCHPACGAGKSQGVIKVTVIVQNLLGIYQEVFEMFLSDRPMDWHCCPHSLWLKNPCLFNTVCLSITTDSEQRCSSCSAILCRPVVSGSLQACIHIMWIVTELILQGTIWNTAFYWHLTDIFEDCNIKKNLWISTCK